MYDTYSQYIYRWLVDTFQPMFESNSDTISSILDKVDNILSIVQNGLYLGVFAFLFWIGFTIVRPHFFKT